MLTILDVLLLLLRLLHQIGVSVLCRVSRVSNVEAAVVIAPPGGVRSVSAVQRWGRRLFRLVGQVMLLLLSVECPGWVVRHLLLLLLKEAFHDVGRSSVLDVTIEQSFHVFFKNIFNSFLTRFVVP